MDEDKIVGIIGLICVFILCFSCGAYLGYADAKDFAADRAKDGADGPKIEASLYVEIIPRPGGTTLAYRCDDATIATIVVSDSSPLVDEEKLNYLSTEVANQSCPTRVVESRH